MTANTPKHSKVIILGSGPAGCTAAGGRGMRVARLQGVRVAGSVRVCALCVCSHTHRRRQCAVAASRVR